MYSGGDPWQDLNEVLRAQEELRALAREEAEARRASRPSRSRRSPAAFRFWRLHVMAWIEDSRS